MKTNASFVNFPNLQLPSPVLLKEVADKISRRNQLRDHKGRVKTGAGVGALRRAPARLVGRQQEIAHERHYLIGPIEMRQVANIHNQREPGAGDPPREVMSVGRRNYRIRFPQTIRVGAAIL